jgi:hypothetical protein
MYNDIQDNWKIYALACFASNSFELAKLFFNKEES